METIILASGSRQRQDYFSLLGLPFLIAPSSIDETFNDSVEPRLAAEELAIQKVNKVREDYRDKE